MKINSTLQRQGVVVLATMALVAAVLGTAITARAEGGSDHEPCVPQDAYTETIVHPAVTHEVTETVVDEPAWTETIPGTPDLWWNWSPNHEQGPFEGPPAFPTDERGTWQGPHENGGPSQDTFGTFQQGNGHGDWFHRDHGKPEQIIEHDAITHEETQTVTDEEAWTETIEHDEVICDDETETPSDDPSTPTDEPSVPILTPTPLPPNPPIHPNPPVAPPTHPNINAHCVGNALVTNTFDADGNRTGTSTKNGAARCAPGANSPKAPQVPVIEEGM